MTKPRANEVESLEEVIKMVSDNKEYMAAILVKAFINTFKDEVEVEMKDSFRLNDYFCVFVDKKQDKGTPVPLLYLALPNKYRDIFED